jgi:hypothetical protein
MLKNVIKIEKKKHRLRKEKKKEKQNTIQENSVL